MPRQKQQKLKKRPDGRYRCAYHGHLFYGRTSEEALAARDEFKRQEDAQEYIREHPTVMQYAATWLSLHKQVSDKCRRDYEVQLAALSDSIGDKYVRSVTVDDAAAVWQHYSGYSASTIKRAKMLFVAMFDSAVENDLCRKNPFRGKGAQPPKAPSGTHRVLTNDEIALIWSTPHRMQLAALIMLYCGLRRGEVIALTADDIRGDFLIVDKAVRFEGNTPVLTHPKTAAGTRTVPIPYILRPMLEGITGRIIAKTDGSMMTETAWSECWDSFVLHLSKNAGCLVDIRPHDLRHTYCTIIISAGVSIKQAMQWMGHSDEKMILHIYDHVTAQRTQTSIDQVEKLLLQGQSEGQT